MKYLSVILCFLGSLYCGAQILTNAWLIQTPLHPDKMESARMTLILSLLGFILTTIGGLVILLRMRKADSQTPKP